MTLKENINIYIFLVLSLILSLFLPINYLIHFTTDDAYFYIKTALNYANGKGSTFDEINLTNGYHPLWFYFLSVIFFIVNSFLKLSQDDLLRLVFIITAFINFFILVLLKQSLYKYQIYNQKKTFNTVVLFLIPFSLYYLIGYESNLLILLTVLYIKFIFDETSSSKKNLLLKCLLIVGIILTRIDYGLLISALLILYEFKYFNYKRAIVITSTIVITYLSYSLFNYLNYGLVSSISSLYKFSTDLSSNIRFFPLPLSNPIDFSLLSGIILIGVIYFFFVQKDKTQNRMIILLQNVYLLNLFYLFIHITINKQGLREWYYILPIFFALLLLGKIIEQFNIQKYFSFIGVLILIIYLTLFRSYYYNHDSAVNFAKKVKAIVKENEKVFQIDYTGLIGFFSERKIVNGDGLINSFQYYNIIKNGNLKEYLKKMNFDYLAFYSFEPQNEEFINYNFHLFKPYLFSFNTNSILLKERFVYGGLFRKKYGYFYLVSIKDVFNNERNTFKSY